METTYLYVSFLLLLASYLFTSHIYHKFSNLPPTIFPTLPIIGHLHLLKEPLYTTLSKLSSKYGPILLLRFGSRRVLLISSHSAAEECFTKNDIVFANRPLMLLGKIIGNNYTSLVWSPHGNNWRNLRRIASTEILSVQRLNCFHHIRVDERMILIRKLVSHSSPAVVDLKSVLYEMTVNVMMRMIYGKRYFGGSVPELEEEGTRFKNMMDESVLLAGIANVIDYIPFLSWFGVNGLEKKLYAVQEKSDVFFQMIIEQLRESKGENKNGTMIQVLLSLQDSDPEIYTDEMIRSLVWVLLAGSNDTTSGTMEWALSLLLNNPQVLHKAQHEIDMHVGKDRFVDESDIVHLPYLRYIINETMRLYPVLPLLVPHESSEDCVIGGYKVPSGTILIVNQWAIHRDPKLWTDPEKFNPERFEGMEGTRDGFKLMPFGSGRRGCPGEGLAIRVLGSTLGLLIQCFEWERVSEKMVDMTEAPGLTMPKAEPLRAKCKPRLEMQNLLSQL